MQYNIWCDYLHDALGTVQFGFNLHTFAHVRRRLQIYITLKKLVQLDCITGRSWGTHSQKGFVHQTFEPACVKL